MKFASTPLLVALATTAALLLAIITPLPTATMLTVAEAAGVDHHIHLCYISQVPIYGKLALFFMRDYYPNISSTTPITSLPTVLQQINYTKVPNNINFTISLFGKNGNELMKDLASEILSDRFSMCNVVIGPGLSGFSITMSGLLSSPQPWLCYAATNILLSNKDSYPSFSRVVPTDTFAAHGTVAVLKAFGYKSASILANNIESARSLISVVETELKNQSGEVYTQFMETTANNATIRAALEGVEARPYRVLLILLEGWSDAFVATMALIKELGLDKKYVIVYGESICSGSGSLVYTLSGGFCAVYQLEMSTYLNKFYQAAYDAEQALPNSTEGLYRDEIVANGFTAIGSGRIRPLNEYTVDSYEMMSVDALSHVMGSAVAAAADGKNISKPSVLLDAFRKYSTRGMTGKVQLDSHGDRLSVAMNLASIDASGALSTFATYDYPSTPTMVPNFSSKIFFPFTSDGRLPASDIKDGFRTTSSSDSSKLDSSIIVGIVIAIVVVGAIVTGLILYFCIIPCLNSTTRYAVTDEKSPFACLTTSIADYDDLSVRLPQEMPDAIQLYNDTITALAPEYGCYESAVLESHEHIVVAKDVESISRLAMAIHTTLYSSTWNCYQELDQYYLVQDAAVDEYFEVHQQDAEGNSDTAIVAPPSNSTTRSTLPPVGVVSRDNHKNSTAAESNMGMYIPPADHEEEDEDTDTVMEIKSGSGGEESDAHHGAVPVIVSDGGGAGQSVVDKEAIPLSSRQISKHKKQRRHRRRIAWGGLRVEICIDFGHGTIARSITSSGGAGHGSNDDDDDHSDVESQKNNKNRHGRKGGASTLEGFIYHGSVVIQSTGLHECCYGGQTLISSRAASHIKDASLKKRLVEVSLINPHASQAGGTSTTDSYFASTSDPASRTTDSAGTKAPESLDEETGAPRLPANRRVAFELRTPVLNRKFPPPYIKKMSTVGAENAVTVYDESAAALSKIVVPDSNALNAPSTHTPSLSLTDNKTHTLKLSSHVSMEAKRQQKRQQMSAMASNPLSTS